jgi:dihydropyrimidinase
MSTRSILIRGGRVVTEQTVTQQDILIKGEQIQAIGHLSGDKAEAVVDAEGLLVLPGGVDTHVHLNDVFMNAVSVHDYYTGTLAAAFGGVTSIVDFSNQVPGGSLKKTLDDKHEEAAGKALIDWGVHPVITEATEETLDEIPYVIEQGAPTIKCYMTYRDDGLLVEDEDLKRIAERLSEEGGMLMLHAEDDGQIMANVPRLIEEGKTTPIYHARSKPPGVELAAIRRIVDMAQETRGRFFVVHLASDEGMDLINEAYLEGLDIAAETCTHYLIFTEKVLERDDGIKWICSPPLRERPIQSRLWRGLRDGRLALVSSDDAAYTWKAKCCGKDRFDKCPNGIPGIEPRLAALYSEGVAKSRLSLTRFVEVVSTAPAKWFGMYPQKGTLLEGSDADIVLFDPEERWTMNQETLHMATDWSAYDMGVVGRVKKVFSRGELIIDGDDCLAEKGRGRYIHRRLEEKEEAA